MHKHFKLVSVLKPKMFIDGSRWCVLYGSNLVEGVAGFGETPLEAVKDFNRAWKKPLSDREPEIKPTYGYIERRDIDTGAITPMLYHPLDQLIPEYGYVYELIDLGMNENQHHRSVLVRKSETATVVSVSDNPFFMIGTHFNLSEALERGFKSWRVQRKDQRSGFKLLSENPVFQGFRYEFCKLTGRTPVVETGVVVGRFVTSSGILENPYEQGVRIDGQEEKVIPLKEMMDSGFTLFRVVEEPEWVPIEEACYKTGEVYEFKRAVETGEVLTLECSGIAYFRIWPRQTSGVPESEITLTEVTDHGYVVSRKVAK